MVLHKCLTKKKEEEEVYLMIVREVEEVPIGVRRSEESFYRLT
jgi:hypothetical protein